MSPYTATAPEGAASLRWLLRTRLAARHTCLDRAIAACCGADALDLGRLLGIHHEVLAALIPALERAGADRLFPGWEGRSRLRALAADLAELGLCPCHAANGGLVFPSEPEVWGALYALEGSRLGNRVLLRRMAEHQRRATRFLAYRLPDDAVWRRFVTRLDALDYRGEACEAVVRGAERVFGAYLAAAARHAGATGG